VSRVAETRSAEGCAAPGRSDHGVVDGSL
jgi:hypothetical protein